MRTDPITFTRELIDAIDTNEVIYVAYNKQERAFKPVPPDSADALFMVHRSEICPYADDGNGVTDAIESGVMMRVFFENMISQHRTTVHSFARMVAIIQQH